MAGRTVRVRGFPAELPPDRAADKLTIHFLRSRNGGGEITDVRVLPGPRGCALITFEAPEVAQRVLAVQNHELSVGGKKFPLEVTVHVEEPSPDEIFIRACVIVDYSKLPAGQTLLRTLLESYSRVQSNFDSKNTHCIVKGPFSELQAFSRDLLGRLRLVNQDAGEILLPEPQPSAESTRETAAPRPNSRSVPEEAAAAPSPRGAVDGTAGAQLEDLSLVLDSDIYSYMQRFCGAEYQGVLRQCRVDAVDVSSDGIAVLYLRPSEGASRDTGALRQARLALQQLYQRLEGSLRKEKVSKRGLDMDSQAIRALMRELQKLYPQLLCHEDEKQLYLIGNLIEVSQAKQHLQDFSSRRGAALLSASLPSQPATSRSAQAALREPRAPAATPARTPGRLELKGDLKLAASFSTLQAAGSQAGQGRLPAPSDPAALPQQQQQQPPVSAADRGLGPAAAPRQKDPEDQDRVKGGAELARPKALPPFRGKESSTWQHPGPLKHHPLTRASSTCDRTRTSSALDSKSSDPRPPLQRSNSFSLPRSKGSDLVQVPGSGGSGVSEEMSLDSLQWSYLKDVGCAALAELCRDGGVQISEQSAGDCTVLTLRAAERSRLFQAKWKVEALVQKCPDLVCQSMSYSELAVDGPDDSALSDLCSLLRGKSLRVGLSKDNYRLHLTCPKEVLPRVTEVFRTFSSRRLRALKSSSSSPGSESSGHSGGLQPSRSQDADTLGSSLESLPLGQQHPNTSDQAVLRAAQLAEAGEKRSPSPWRSQQVLGQEQEQEEKAKSRVDSGAVPGGSSLLSPVVEKPNPAGLKEPQEQPRRKLSGGEPDVARLKQVLPDRFQFTRDKSRAEQSEAMGPVPAADGAPHSLPTWLHRALAAEPLQAGARQPPAPEPRGQERTPAPEGRSNVQEEPALLSQQTRDPSLSQESNQPTLGQCDACQGKGVTCQAPCGHALCRTCFAADRAQPACCSSRSVTRSHKISGTFRICSLSQSLPGYFRDPTLQVAYSIPDGVQGAGDPHPGQPYRGGDFFAFLPDNKEGQKTAVLLKKAFEQGLTFQIKSCSGEDRVTWGCIPHKTRWEGGKARNGYPDSHYLQEVCTVLRSLGVA